MSLEQKILKTRAVLEQVLQENGPERAAVAWTGGKDSTVVLWLWRGLLLERDLAPVLAVNLDTGVEFPEIAALRDELARKWNVALHIETPGVDLQGYPVARDKLECCQDLKILPLQRALRRLNIGTLLTGLRRDEHADRAGRDFFEARQNPDHIQVNPILDWTEMDVWAFTMEQALPYCPLYDKGYRSLDCMPCTKPVAIAAVAAVHILASDSGHGGERDGRDKDKETRMEALRSLGYF